MEKSIPEFTIFKFVFEEKKGGLENKIVINSSSYAINILLNLY
jgi:hypothetical protein